MSGPGHHARHITVSRRVAMYDGGPNRRALLYIYRTSDGKTCKALLWRGHGAGVGCSPGPLFRHARVEAGEMHFFYGVAADEITRIVLVRAPGIGDGVPLSRDPASSTTAAPARPAPA